MNQEPPSTIARAKACGANVRAGRITFPSVEALESFARAWQRATTGVDTKPR